MSTGGNGTQRIPQAHGGALVPFRKGQSGNPAGVSKERRELYEAIESRQVPKVLDLLDALYERALHCDDEMAANTAAKLWLDQVRGPVKASDDDKIAAAVEEQLAALIARARARRAEQQQEPSSDVPAGEQQRTG